MNLAAQVCINRNIVECKSGNDHAGYCCRTGINRNIVECKFFIFYDTEIAPSVLIETLWNVNTMELTAAVNELLVLIETLWNVNSVNTVLHDGVNFVLIETLWNVNKIFKVFNELKLMCINRNIVECK